MPSTTFNIQPATTAAKTQTGNAGVRVQNRRLRVEPDRQTGKPEAAVLAGVYVHSVHSAVRQKSDN